VGVRRSGRSTLGDPDLAAARSLAEPDPEPADDLVAHARRIFQGDLAEVDEVG